MKNLLPVEVASRLPAQVSVLSGGTCFLQKQYRRRAPQVLHLPRCLDESAKQGHKAARGSVKTSSTAVVHKDSISTSALHTLVPHTTSSSKEPARAPYITGPEATSVGNLETRDSGTTFEEAMLNAVNILLGVGLLSIPYALCQGGWSALGVLGLLGGVTNYTGKLLGRCQERMCLLNDVPREPGQLVRGLKDYESIGEAAFGRFGRDLITWVLYIELIGTCGLFFILEGDNLARLFGGDPTSYMYGAAFFLIPTTWLPDLSALAALGLLGALASFSVLGLVIYTYITEGFISGTGHALVHPDTLPLTFGLLAFVYAGHAVFPNIQASMQKPSDYPKMLDLTYIIVGSISALVGVIGYQMYGSDVKEEIILNFPAGVLATVATGLIVINPFTKFALTLDPVARGVEAAMGFKQQRGSSKSMLLPFPKVAARTALGAAALFLATSVPFFGSIMALIGSCLTIAVSVIFPSLAYLQLFGGQLDVRERYWNYCVVGIGIACAVSGTYTSLDALKTGHLSAL